MKILFISPTSRAGTPQYTHNLANALADHGHEVAYASGVSFELAEYPRRYYLLEVFDRYRIHPPLVWNFFRFLSSFRPEIIHYQGALHPLTYLFSWAVLRILTRARFVYTPQEILPFGERSYYHYPLRVFYKQMEHVFLNAEQNRSVAIDLLNVKPDKITVLPMADLLAFLRENLKSITSSEVNTHKSVLFFGQILERKGLDVLIAAFPKVLEHVPEAQLCIAGKAQMDITPYLENIEYLELSEHTIMDLSYVTFDKMADYFQSASVVVLPYRVGWNSGVLASAFGFGKPVIVTRVGGLEEIVDAEVSGLIVEPEDPVSLADAIVRVLTDQTLKERLDIGVSEAAGFYSWNTIAQQTEDQYLNVLHDRSCIQDAG